PLAHISDIKLIRTDTTLDLSQKAEKGMRLVIAHLLLLYTADLSFFFSLNQCGNLETLRELPLIKIRRSTFSINTTF
ncbi:hypothetical protein CISIN_1g048099mg, partial [Citrus sinensis]